MSIVTDKGRPARAAPGPAAKPGKKCPKLEPKLPLRCVIDDAPPNQLAAINIQIGAVTWTMSQLAAINIPIGSVTWTMRLVRGLIPIKDGYAIGLANRDTCEILISDTCHPSRRFKTAWHEIAHAWHYELHPDHSTVYMDFEEQAELISMGMASITPKIIASIYRLVNFE